MKHCLTVFIIFLFGLNTYSQEIKNYDLNGDCPKNKKYKIDFLKTNIIYPQNSSSKGLGISDLISGGTIGTIAGIGLNLINNAIAKKQLSYTATYSNSSYLEINSAQFDSLKNQQAFLVLTRYGINAINDKLSGQNQLEQFVFSIHYDTSFLELKLEQVSLDYTKANSKKGDNLAIAIDLKLSTSNSGSKAQDANQNSASSNSGTNSLGDINIKIPIIDRDSLISIDTDKRKFIDQAYFQALKISSHNDVLLQITATITESNIDHLTPSVVDNLLKNNGSDIVSALNSILTGSSGSSKKSK